VKRRRNQYARKIHVSGTRFVRRTGGLQAVADSALERDEKSVSIYRQTPK
jgi:hypothetical protein